MALMFGTQVLSYWAMFWREGEQVYRNINNAEALRDRDSEIGIFHII